MTVPLFLSSSYHYFERANVTDVQTIIDDFEDQVLANSPAWTNPSANTYNSPVDGYGRTFQLAFTRTDARRLDCVYKDQNGVTVMTRRILLPSATPAVVKYFTGQYHFCIDVYDYSSTPEYLIGGILDLSPESQNAHQLYCWGFGTRDTSDSYNNGWYQYAYMIDNGSPILERRIPHPGPYISGDCIPNVDAMGYWIYTPAPMYVLPVGFTYYRYAGKMYQALLVPKMAAAPGAIIDVPIDAGVTGRFMVLSGILESAIDYPLTLAMRISD